MGLPATLWKHIGVELWRLLLLTAVILVTVIAFAAAIKPLADGKLGPAETIKFMFLAMPPMLAYAVPFAAGFAATLTYHRLNEDNEVIASFAGGISHRALLAPALASGLALSVVMAGLNESVIPRFLRSMEQLVTQDITKLMVWSIRRGEPLVMGSMHLHADDVRVLDPASDPRVAATGATDWLELSGVVFADTDRWGKIRNEAIVRQAPVLIIPGESAEGRRVTTAWIYPRNGVGLRGSEGLMVFDELDPMRMDIPNAFDDDPKYLTFTELASLRDEPDRMSFIRTRSRDLAHHLAERETTEQIAGDFARAERTRLERGGEPWVLRASGIRWDPREFMWRLIPPTGQSEVVIDRRRGASQNFSEIRATSAWLYTDLRTDENGIDLTLSLRLQGVTSRDGDDIADVGQREQQIFENIHPARDPLPELLTLGADELLAKASPRVDIDQPDPFLVPSVKEMRKRLGRLEREILSKQHERMAMASAALVMVLTGAISAVRLRGATPLAVYMWSFFPALGAVLTISAGQQVTHHQGAAGLILLWGGVLGLLAYTLRSYAKLRKH